MARLGYVPDSAWRAQEAAYRRYCWPVTSLADFKLAPFHLLAGEGAVYVDKDHRWHMETLARLAAVDGELFRATAYQVVDLNNQASHDAAVAWWESLTTAGGEGMVVKPLNFVERGPRGLLYSERVSAGHFYSGKMSKTYPFQVYNQR